MKQIPKKIHLLFLNANEEKPRIFAFCCDRIKKLHPDWDVILYDDKQAREVLAQSFPELLPIYLSYPLNVMKSDLFRIAVVYLFGGFYMDMDMFCIKKLEALRNYPLILSEEKTLSNNSFKNTKLKYRLRIANYMFGGAPKHSFWLKLLAHMLLKSKNSLENENDVLENTGPGLITNIYHKHKKLFPDIYVLRNIDRRCPVPSHNEISCYFGSFAAHLHQGTWRGKNFIKQNNASNISEQQKKIALTTIYKEITIKSNEIKIVKPHKNHDSLFNVDNIIKQLTEKFNFLRKSNSNTKAQFVVFGIPTLEEQLQFFTKKNILIASSYNTSKDILRIDYVNSYYSYCMVFDESDKKRLREQGITIPVKVLPHGFAYINRTKFTDTKALPKKNFIVGLYVKEILIDFHYLLRMLIKLREQKIPNLKVVVLYDKSDSTFDHKIFFNKHPWIKFHAKTYDLSTYFRKIHCFISLNANDIFDINPLSSLSLGIPTILYKRDIDLHNKIQKFCLSIDSKNIKTSEQLAAELTKALESMYINFNFWDKKAVANANSFEDKYSIGKVVLKIIETIKSLD